MEYYVIWTKGYSSLIRCLFDPVLQQIVKKSLHLCLLAYFGIIPSFDQKFLNFVKPRPLKTIQIFRRIPPPNLWVTEKMYSSAHFCWYLYDCTVAAET
jgi:hypothetical protein